MNMKRMILNVMLAAVAMCGWAADDSSNKLKVKLDLVDFGDTVVVYHSRTDFQAYPGKDGKFEFELQVDSVSTVMLLQPRILRGDMENPRVYSLPLVGGEEVCVVDTEKTRYDVDGTGFYADFHQMDLFNEKAEMDLSDNEITDEDYQQMLIDYMKAHTKQEAAMWLLSKMDDPEKMEETYMLFDASVREGRMKVFYDRWTTEVAMRAKELAAQKKSAAGNEAPAFTLNDLEGKPLSLASLRGKYVVLDFWGSWCIWCIKGFPQMKEYYAKYAGKFEILGVDCQDKVGKWKAAVAKHELPWLHVYCPEESTLLDDYGITAFPTKIIVGPDGKIVKTIVGEDPSFYTLLDELFK